MSAADAVRRGRRGAQRDGGGRAAAPRTGRGWCWRIGARRWSSSAALEAAGVRVDLGPHRDEDVRRRRPGRAESRRAARASRSSTRRGAAGVPVIGELELATRAFGGASSRSRARRASRRRRRSSGGCSSAGGFRTRRGRQHRRAAVGAGRRLDSRHHARGRGEQLPARDGADVPPGDRGVPELLARPSRSARHRGGVRGREGADLREPGGRRLGGAQRRRPRGGAAGRRTRGHGASGSPSDRCPAWARALSMGTSSIAAATAP